MNVCICILCSHTCSELVFVVVFFCVLLCWCFHRCLETKCLSSHVPMDVSQGWMLDGRCMLDCAWCRMHDAWLLVQIDRCLMHDAQQFIVLILSVMCLVNKNHERYMHCMHRMNAASILFNIHDCVLMLDPCLPTLSECQRSLVATSKAHRRCHTRQNTASSCDSIEIGSAAVGSHTRCRCWERHSRRVCWSFRDAWSFVRNSASVAEWDLSELAGNLPNNDIPLVKKANPQTHLCNN